jgi:hypothetical protein
VGKPFDLVKEFSKFGREQNVSLSAAESLNKFGSHAVSRLSEAMRDGALMHGLRAESMFGAMVVTLGAYQLLRHEDSGEIHPRSEYRSADYRVVLGDGANWLIEVKNVYETNPSARRQLMRRAYREQLEAYAKATGGELKLAIYWAKWAIWTLVTPSRLVDASGDLSLDLIEAMKVNEMHALGDLSVATKPPLELHLTMDQARSGPIQSDGHLQLTIRDAQIFCAGEHLASSAEQELAWAFMQYGDWSEHEAVLDVQANRLVRIVHRWDPEVDHDQGFEVIGSLSRMFSRYYSEQTIRSGELVSLNAAPRPGWFDALKDWDSRGYALPLWRFQLRPNYAAGGSKSTERGSDH